jgi:adenylate cyclase
MGSRAGGSYRRLRLTLFLGVATVLTGLMLAAYLADAFRDIELDTVDARFSVRGETEPPKELAVVAIDDVTFGELRERWPFRRGRHAQAIDRLSEDGARAIAYDIQFTEPSEEPEQDEALIASVEHAGHVVLATTEVDSRGRSGVFGDDRLVREIGARAAHSALPNDPGGVFRRVPHEVDRLESFAVAAVEFARGRQVDRDDFGGDTAWIDFHGEPGTIETVPFSRVVQGRTRPGLFRDKIVVVGPSAPTLQDVHPTSTASEDLMSGAEIQANAISTVLRDFPLKELPGGIDALVICLLGLVGPATALRFGAVRAALIGVALAALFLVAAQLAFQGGVIVSLVYPLGSLALGVVGALAVGVVVGAFERQRVRDLFARFVPEPVVDEVLSSADDDLRLGGQRRTVTVLFSDIRGFTTFSETHDPEVVIEILNRYLSDMTKVILDHGGTLVCFMGDGIMAVFGAPIEQPDHADRALAAAREMAGPVLEDFNAWMRQRGIGDGFRIGIGLNSGEVMAGNVGSEQRLDYTVIGDTTNTASRLEGMTKDTPHTIFVADSTRAALQSGDPGLVRVAEREVRGRQARVVIWSTPGVPATDGSDSA